MAKNGKDGRKKASETQLRYKAEAEIIAKDGLIGPTEMVKRLAEYGFKVSRQTVTEDLKKDLEAISTRDISNYKSHILNNLADGSQAMYDLSQNSTDPEIKIKAWNAYNRGVKIQAQVVTKFEEAKLKLKDIERPIIHVYFGELRETQKTKREKKEEKDTYFKSGDGQDTLYGGKEE